MQLPRLPSKPKGDRDGTRASLSYLLDEAPDDQEGNTVPHWAVGSPKQVYFEVFRSFATFLQSAKRGGYKGLGGASAMRPFEKLKTTLLPPCRFSRRGRAILSVFLSDGKQQDFSKDGCETRANASLFCQQGALRGGS